MKNLRSIAVLVILSASLSAVASLNDRSTLNLPGSFDLEQMTWGPGSNDIRLGGGLNYTTQPGVGWSVEIDGVFVTGWSITNADRSEFLSTTVPKNVVMSVPDKVFIEVWDLSQKRVIASNVTYFGLPIDPTAAPSNTLIFSARPNVRYAGFAWYIDNRRAGLAIYGRTR